MESGPGPEGAPDSTCGAMATLLQHPVSQALVGAHLNDYIDKSGPRRHLQAHCGRVGAASLVGCCRAAVEWSRAGSSPLHRWARDAVACWPDPAAWPAQRKLPAQLCRKVPAKKRHEVAQLAPLVADLCRRHGARVVVDVGAGQVRHPWRGACFGFADSPSPCRRAHLPPPSWRLAFTLSQSSRRPPTARRQRSGSTASCAARAAGGPAVDPALSHTRPPPAAQSRRRLPTSASPRRPCSHYCTRTSRPSAQALPSKAPAASRAPSHPPLTPFLRAPLPPRLSSAGVVLVGLHPCGDLGSHLLRLAVAPALAGVVRGAVLVSCCWNLLTEGWEGSAVDGPSPECVMRHAEHVSAGEAGEGGEDTSPVAPGYPLSRSVATAGPSLRLGAVARNMACQSFEREAPRCSEEVRRPPSRGSPLHPLTAVPAPPPPRPRPPPRSS